MNPRSPATSMIAIVLLVVALVLVYQSLRFSLAEVNNRQARIYELFWKEQGSIKKLEQWQRALTLSGRAMALNTSNPDFYLRESRLLEWYGFTSEPEGEQIRARLDEAATFLDKAIELRPQSALGYSARALLAARRWQLDEFIASDIVTALDLGRWELDVHLQVSHAAMATWPGLSEEAQSAYLAHFDKVLLRRGKWGPSMFRIAEQYGRVRVLCNRVAMLNSVSETESQSSLCQDQG